MSRPPRKPLRKVTVSGKSAARRPRQQHARTPPRYSLTVTPTLANPWARWRFVTEFPASASGKVQKFRMREIAADGVADQSGAVLS